MTTDDDNGKPHWIVGAVKTVGVPTVFLGILLYMIYSSGSWAGTEVVIPIFKKQTEFIDRTAAVVEEIRDAVVDDAVDVNAVLKQGSENRNLITETSKEQTVLLEKIAENTDKQQLNENEHMLILKEIADNTRPKP